MDCYLWENTEILYLPSMIQFRNLEFILFAMRGFKLTLIGEIQEYVAQYRGQFFTFTLH